MVDASYTGLSQITDYSLRQLGSDGIPGGTVQSHVVRAGDTLQTIAQIYFGSPAYWYLIADANGLSGSERLAEGVTLTIPNQVANSANSAQTFKVYNESEVIGSTSPEIRTVAKKKKWWQKLIMIIIIVILIIATIYTAGAASGAWGAAGAGAGAAGGTAAGGAAVAGGTAAAGGAAAGTVAAGAVTAGTVAATTVAAASVGGTIFAAGSALGASLVTGMGLGYAGALAVAAGVGAATFAAASVLTQGLAVAAGLQESFSWKNVGKAAVGGAVSGAASFLTAGFAAGNAVANASRTTEIATRVGVETGRQLITDGKISNVAGLIGAAAAGGAFSSWGTASTFIGANARSFGAGLSLLEGKARGQGDNTMGWVGLATAALFDASGTASTLTTGGEANWRYVAVQAIGAAVVGSRYGEDAALSYIGNAIGGGLAGDAYRDGPGMAARAQEERARVEREAYSYRNGMDVESDGYIAPSSNGSGLRLGGGGSGLRLSGGAVQAWSDGIDGGIALNGSMAPRDEARAPRTYTVQRGDNPASIGMKFFGDERAGATILADNGLDASVRGARNLPVGTVLTLRDDINDGSLRAGGRLIGADSSIRVQDAAIAAGAAAAADQASADALRVGAWSGRTNQAASGGQASGAAIDTPYAQSVGNAFAAIGQAGVGFTELVVGGAYNAVVRMAGGAASTPYLAISADAAMAVQDGYKDRFGYEMKSSGALAFGQAVQPAGLWLQNNLVAPTRAYSESLIGDGATTILGAGAQAGFEIAGLVTGGRAAQTFLDNSVLVTRPAAGLYGGIPVDALFGTTRITTVTGEMSARFQGMGYVDPLTNRFKAAPIGSTMAVDHTFPSAEIVQLPSFNTLTKQQMTNIIQDRIELGNLQPLPTTFNSSKGSSTNWTMYKEQALDAGYASNLRVQQQLISDRIEAQIQLYKQQNLRGGR